MFLLAAPVAAVVALFTVCGAAGCGARDNGLFGPGSGSEGGGGSGGDGGSGGGTVTPTHADRVDILLTIDNSRSMADKQAILGVAVPDLVQALTNPACLDAKGVPAPSQPLGSKDPCPGGTSRQFPPVADIHIGVITTSLGGHGADACSAMTEPTENDKARLIARTAAGAPVPTYQNMGFLAWDPEGKLSPPGEKNLGTLTTTLDDMVLGAGQKGCGYEATLESWYRFLVEPDPHESVQIQNNTAVLSGTDNTLLQQRKDFLRPDSLLLVLMLSDENDCSIRDGGQYFYAAQIYQQGGGSSPYHLPRARAACEIDPQSECCRSCGQPPGTGCSDANDVCEGTLSALEDHINLRCWDQKRRFGIDFLYPIDRYVAGLSSPEVQDRNGQVVPNPLFSDLDPNDGVSTVRGKSLVFLSAIVGVPWQDIARRSGGKPDLIKGTDASGNPVGAFQSPSELAQNGTWNVILGNPAKYHEPSARPTDPLMVEHYEPRSGTNPVTGQPLAPPGASYGANSINGHEYSIQQRSDLQYACVFRLPQPRNCTDPNQVACDCTDPGNDNPLCQNPATDVFGTTQYRAKAYPGIRHLQLVKALGDQGVLGSICPAQIDDFNVLDFGYRPTVRTTVAALASALN